MKLQLSKLVAQTGLTIGLTLGASWVQADTGKLLLTGGVSTIAGSAGGGLSPWAVIGTNATEGELGLSVFASRSITQDYSLNSYGLAVGIHERLELSVAQQDFDASPAVALNGIAPFGIAKGQHIQMDVLGVKVKVAGDAVLNSDSWMPQISIGLEYKAVRPGSMQSVFDFMGVKNNGTDFYVSATKLLLAKGLLLNATLRSTNANQGGLLGFGAASTGTSSRSVVPEFAVAFLVNPSLAIGVEYRAMSNNLESVGSAAGLGNALRADDWKDIFVAWAPSKNFSLTLAYVDLGQVVPGVTTGRRQTGTYLSTQFAF